MQHLANLSRRYFLGGPVSSSFLKPQPTGHAEICFGFDQDPAAGAPCSHCRCRRLVVAALDGVGGHPVVRGVGIVRTVGVIRVGNRSLFIPTLDGISRRLGLGAQPRSSMAVPRSSMAVPRGSMAVPRGSIVVIVQQCQPDGANGKKCSRAQDKAMGAGFEVVPQDPNSQGESGNSGQEVPDESDNPGPLSIHIRIAIAMKAYATVADATVDQMLRNCTPVTSARSLSNPHRPSMISTARRTIKTYRPMERAGRCGPRQPRRQIRQTCHTSRW